MITLDRRIQFYIFFLFTGALIGLFAFFNYPLFHSLFPSFKEVEIQWYYLSVAFLFGIFVFVYWMNHLIITRNVYLPFSLSALFNFLVIVELFFLLIIFPLILQDNSFIKVIYYSGVTRIRDIHLLHVVVGILLLSLSLIPLYFVQEILNHVKKINLNKNWFKLFKNINVNRIYAYISIMSILVLSFYIPSISSIDYAYYIGPINDVLHDKLLLINTPSQYGFLSIATLAAVFKVIKIGLLPMMIVNAIIVSLGYLGVFVLMRFLFKSKFLSFFAISVTIFATYIVQTEERGWFPQTSFLRFGFWVLAALMILMAYLKKKYFQIFMNVLFPLITSIGLFWSFDSGAYLVLAYLCFIFFQSLSASLRKFSYQFIKRIISFFSILLGVTLTITCYYFFRFGIWIEWHQLIVRSQYYLQGFGLLPLERTSWPWIILAGYLCTLAYLFLRKMMRKNSILIPEETLLSYILFYGIFQFAYFMGRSGINNLHHVSIPFFICIFFIIDKLAFWSNKNIGLACRVILLILISFAMGIPITLIGLQGFNNISSGNILTSTKTLFSYNKIQSQYYRSVGWEQTVMRIEQEFGSYIREHGITILSAHDTWYLLLLNRSNNITSNNLQYFIETSDLKLLANQILQQKDKYIFIDHQKNLDRAQVATVFSMISSDYKFLKNLGNLDLYERL